MKSKFEILLEKVANQPLSKENEERIKGAFEKSKKGKEMIPFVLQKDPSVEQKNLAQENKKKTEKFIKLISKSFYTDYITNST